jgi:hypothetical protein
MLSIYLLVVKINLAVIALTHITNLVKDLCSLE